MARNSQEAHAENIDVAQLARHLEGKVISYCQHEGLTIPGLSRIKTAIGEILAQDPNSKITARAIMQRID